MARITLKEQRKMHFDMNRAAETAKTAQLMAFYISCGGTTVKKEGKVHMYFKSTTCQERISA
jgi:hypothetical protein